MRLSCLILIAACTATPLPEAPAAPVPDLIEGLGGTSSQTTFIGQLGAVEPGVTVRIWSLGSSAASVDVVANPDGGFEAMSPGVDGTFRIEVIGDTARSLPVDVDIMGDEVVVSACYELVVQQRLPIGGDDLITVRNVCDMDATLTARLRAPAGITVETTAADLLAGGRVDILVDATEAAEEILLIELMGPASDTRAVTLFTD